MSQTAVTLRKILYLHFEVYFHTTAFLPNDTTFVPSARLRCCRASTKLFILIVRLWQQTVAAHHSMMVPVLNNARNNKRKHNYPVLFCFCLGQQPTGFGTVLANIPNSSLSGHGFLIATTISPGWSTALQKNKTWKMHCNLIIVKVKCMSQQKNWSLPKGNRRNVQVDAVQLGAIALETLLSLSCFANYTWCKLILAKAPRPSCIMSFE